MSKFGDVCYCCDRDESECKVGGSFGVSHLQDETKQICFWLCKGCIKSIPEAPYNIGALRLMVQSRPEKIVSHTHETIPLFIRPANRGESSNNSLEEGRPILFARNLESERNDSYTRLRSMGREEGLSRTISENHSNNRSIKFI